METNTANRIKPRATLNDILGTGTTNGNGAIDRRWKRHFYHLSELRDKIMRHRDQMAISAKEGQTTYSLHMADAGTDQYDCDFALGMVSADQESLYEIEEALNRIRRGSYGICEVSGLPIEEERLEVLPWTRFSAAAQLELEKNGAVRYVGLGKRNGLPQESASDEDEDTED
jgi:RNA polymerase-binding transcription factor DksA